MKTDPALQGFSDSWSDFPTAEEAAAACQAAQNGQSGSFSGAALAGCDLSGVDLVDLLDAWVGVANLSRANPTGANLSGVNLIYADLTGANLSRANLSRANLSRANLSGARLNFANLTGANLTDANLGSISGLPDSLTSGTLPPIPAADSTGVIWSNTTCPDGTNSDNHADTCVGCGI